MSQKQLILFNASAAKTSSCHLRTHYTIIEGYCSKANSIEIEFGSAVHLFIKEWRSNGGNYNLAMQAARDYLRSIPISYDKSKEWMREESFLMLTCFNWAEFATNDDLVTCSVNGIPLVEQKFSIPYYVDDEVEVLLCGTIDDICRKGKDGAYIIRDYKTTGTWNRFEFFNRFELSPQLMFYKFILQQYATLFPESEFFQELTKRDFGCQIEGIFLKNGTKSAGTKPSSEIERSSVFFYKQEQMNEFKRLLDKKIAHIVEETKAYMKTGNRPDRYGMLNGACYGCPYTTVCASSDDTARGFILHNNFQRKPYNPLDYNA